MTIVVFSLPVWTLVLTLTISRMMSCGWILNTPMGKGSVQVQSVVKCVCGLIPRPSYCGSGNETMEYVSDVSVSWLVVLYCPDTSLGTQPSFQTQLA